MVDADSSFAVPDPKFADSVQILEEFFVLFREIQTLTQVLGGLPECWFAFVMRRGLP